VRAGGKAVGEPTGPVLRYSGSATHALRFTLIMFMSAQKARLYLRRVRSIAKRAASSADPMKRIRGSLGSSPMGARARF